MLALWLCLCLPALAQKKPNQYGGTQKPEPTGGKPVTPPKAARHNEQKKAGKTAGAITGSTNRTQDLGRANAYDKSRQQTFSPKVNNTAKPPSAGKSMAKRQSAQSSAFEAHEAESNVNKRAKAYDKSRQQTFSPKLNTELDPASRRTAAREASDQAASLSKGALSREYKKAAAYDKSRQMNFNPKLNAVAAPSVGKERARSNSSQIAEGDKLNTVPTGETSAAKAKANSGKIAAFAEGNTMDRKAYREMLKKNGRKMMAATQGNTMERTDYEKMVKRRSQRIAEATKGNTMGREDHERLMKNKSEDIADYQAGYLNTKAERKARLRSLIHPKEYQANSPQEQRARARSKSDEIASFAGKKKRSSHRKVENAHPSSKAYNKRLALSSMNARGTAQRRGAREVNKNKKSFLPVFLRKKTPKAKYDDVEKDMWYK